VPAVDDLYYQLEQRLDEAQEVISSITKKLETIREELVYLTTLLHDTKDIEGWSNVVSETKKIQYSLSRIMYYVSLTTFGKKAETVKKTKRLKGRLHHGTPDNS